MAKKFLSFFELCAWFIGAVGGFGYALYNKAYFIGACIVVLAWMAWPSVRKCWDNLHEV